MLFKYIIVFVLSFICVMHFGSTAPSRNSVLDGLKMCHQIICPESTKACGRSEHTNNDNMKENIVSVFCYGSNNVVLRNITTVKPNPSGSPWGQTSYEPI